MKKLIIFEGIDQIGKSSFMESYRNDRNGNARILKDQIQLNTSNPIKSYLQHPEWFYETKHVGYMLGLLNGLLYSDHRDLIFDRLHLTAFAYAHALRPTSLRSVFRSEEDMLAFNNEIEDFMIKNFDPYLITFHINPEDQHKIKEDEVVTSNDLFRVNGSFETAFDKSKLKKLKIGLNYKMIDGKELTNIFDFKDEIIDFIH